MVIYTFIFNVSRLICVCSSSGSICLLRVNLDINREASHPGMDVQEFARLDLQGDVFSSPVMIGGRIFVGCRDDYVHCIVVEIQSLLESYILIVSVTLIIIIINKPSLKEKKKSS